jgi:hypothetical protein
LRHARDSKASFSSDSEVEIKLKGRLTYEANERKESSSREPSQLLAVIMLLCEQKVEGKRTDRGENAEWRELKMDDAWVRVAGALLLLC